MSQDNLSQDNLSQSTLSQDNLSQDRSSTHISPSDNLNPDFPSLQALFESDSQAFIGGSVACAYCVVNYLCSIGLFVAIVL
jgi:hypothetical protein